MPLLPNSYDMTSYCQKSPPMKMMIAMKGDIEALDEGGVELNADPSQFISLCSLLQGAIGEELHAKVACLSSAPSKLEGDPTLEPPALAAVIPSFGI